MADEYSADNIKEPEDIEASNASVSFLIGKQIDRINYLASIRLALSNDLNSKSMVASSLVISIGFLEALFSPKIKNEEYFDKANKIKKILLEPIGQKVNEYELNNELNEDMATQFFLYEKNPNLCIKYCLDWYNLLTKYAKETGIYPDEQIGMVWK